jgi:hypothetical protein
MTSGTDQAHSPGQEGHRKPYHPFALIGGLMLVAAAVVGIVLLGSRQGPTETRLPPQDLAEEALTYASQTTLSDLRLSAEENFLGQQVVYLDGKISNAGVRNIRQLTIRLSFLNLEKQVVLRQDHGIFGGPQSLGPRQTKEFQIRFDQIPDSWDRQVPQIQIVALRADRP